MSTDLIGTICRSVMTVVLLAGTAAFVAPLSATAAHIEVSNCQPTEVRICSYDTKDNPDGDTGSYLLEQTDQRKFTCHDNCSFRIIDCSQYNDCNHCKEKGLWLDDSWGKGTYNLVGLTLNQKEDGYATSNFEKTDSSKVCE